MPKNLVPIDLGYQADLCIRRRREICAAMQAGLDNPAHWFRQSSRSQERLYHVGRLASQRRLDPARVQALESDRSNACPCLPPLGQNLRPGFLAKLLQGLPRSRARFAPRTTQPAQNRLLGPQDEQRQQNAALLAAQGV
jgi:hypothetical protein